MSDDPVANTDRELWRERQGDYYADSIHVTAGGGIGVNCGGLVIVLPIREWHALAARDLAKLDKQRSDPAAALKALQMAIDRLANHAAPSFHGCCCRDDAHAAADRLAREAFEAGQHYQCDFSTRYELSKGEDRIPEPPWLPKEAEK